MLEIFNRDSYQKRFISGLLVFCVFSTETAFALDDGFFTDLGATSIENQTNGLKTFTDVNGHRVASFGGSLVLKRKQAVYPLWWHFQAPEIQASCSGISFKGMFGSIANLDEIQKQLEQAGSSFAWGVLVGIIYSLPGIGEIFSKLDAWAKKIQAMLADACNAGINLGKSIGEAGNNYIDEKAKSWYNDSAPAWIKDVGKNFGGKDDKISELLDCASDYMDNIGSGLSCEDLKKQVKADIGVGNMAFPSLIGGVLQKYQKQNNNFPIAVSYPNHGVVVDWTSPSVFSSGVNDSFYQDVALAGLIIGLTGDSAPAGKLEEVIKESTKQLMRDGTNKATKTSASKQIQNAVATYQDEKSRCELVGANNITPTEIADYLYGGANTMVTRPGDSNATSTLSTEQIKKLGLPKLFVFKSADSGRSTGNYVILPSQERTSFGATSGDVVMNSISNHLINWSGVTGTAEKMMQCYLEDTNCGALSNILFDTPSARYLAKVYRNTKEPTEKNAIREKTEFYIRSQLFEVILEKLNQYKSSFTKEMKYATPTAGTNSSPSDSNSSSSMGPEAAPHAVFASCTNDIKNQVNKVVDEFSKYHKLLEADLGKNQTKSDFFFFLGIQDKRNNANALGEFKK